uniref:Phage protein n=1 Tax=Heterorhabditis bacteriophora TaxID=37862 RepID=A0A1I7WV84_HETBA
MSKQLFILKMTALVVVAVVVVGDELAIGGAMYRIGIFYVEYLHQNGQSINRTITGKREIAEKGKITAK